MPFEEVRDFFYDRNNYIGDLDLAAEQMFAENGMRPGGLNIQLSELMRDRFGITVVIDAELSETTKRRYDADTKVLRVARWLMPGQRALDRHPTRSAQPVRPHLGQSWPPTTSSVPNVVASPGSVWPTTSPALSCCPIASSTRPQRSCARTSTCWAAGSGWVSRLFATGFPHCNARSSAESRSSSSGPTKPETSHNASRPRHFISVGWAAAASFGWYPTRSPNQGGCHTKLNPSTERLTLNHLCHFGFSGFSVGFLVGGPA
jgi:hypothetical protein